MKKISTIVRRLTEAVRKKEETLTHWNAECVDRKQQDGCYGMVQKYLSTSSKIINYLVTLSKSDFRMDDIDSEFIETFAKYLKDDELKENTIHFHLRNFSAMYHQLYKDYTNNPFKRINMRSCTTSKRAVDRQTMQRIKELEAGKKSLDFSRDLFLFSFYTQGMSFVDIAYLKKSDITENTIRYKRRKTSQPITVTLIPEAREIISRYANKSNYIFAIIKSEKQEDAYRQYRNGLASQNRRLKTISNILGLEQPLTTYTARHTWATLAQNKGVPTAVISRSLGHTSETTTRIYLGSMDTKMLAKYNRLTTRL